MLKCRGVALLFIRSLVIGNEASAKRKRYTSIIEVKDSLDSIEILRISSKAIAEKADFGSILLPLTETDQEKLQVYTERGFPMPNIKLSVYKNRRGSFVRGYLWMQMDKSTCRYETVFATDWDYKQLPITAFDIEQPVM